MEYEFTFVVDGVSVDDEDAVRALRERLDALLARAAGQDLITIAYPGGDAVDAALRAAGAITHVVPKARALRLDPGLVGISDIAELTERTRQNVTQWINGKRQGRRPFPAPIGTAGQSLVWLWTDVNTWLRDLDLDDGMNYPAPAEITTIDRLLRQQTTVHLTVHHPEPPTESVRRTVDELQRFFPTFAEYLTRFPETCDAEGRHIVVVADPDEHAAAALRRVMTFAQPVVLATTTSQFVSVVLSPDTTSAPADACPLEHGMTVRDWLGLMITGIATTFTLPDTPPIRSTNLQTLATT